MNNTDRTTRTEPRESMIRTFSVCRYIQSTVRYAAALSGVVFGVACTTAVDLGTRDFTSGDEGSGSVGSAGSPGSAGSASSPDSTGSAGSAGATSSGKAGPNRCGDGVVQSNEACDDGNQLSGDGCSAECSVEPQWSCAAPGTPCVKSLCGDGVVQAGEECDDGKANSDAYAGCSRSCRLGPHCGDGILQTDFEQCDDGNQIDGDGCDSNCTILVPK
jgi:cysteine-rich repeat protein